jgi:PAS domain S-box-containing protein
VAPEWTEPKRSAALRSYGILDTAREEDFDDLARIAAKVCGTPIGVVNLVDTDRQFFKAEIGLGVRSTPLETAFCRHALLCDDVLVIPDATKDARLECNPLVTGEPHLRAYAGALLRTPEGLPIGTVCVLDYAIREFTEDQVDMLRFLARQAMTQLELRRRITDQEMLLKRTRVAEQRKAGFERLVKQVSQFIGMADAKGNVIFLNDAARDIVGLSADDSSRRHTLEYVAEKDRARFLEEAMPLIRQGEALDIEVMLRDLRNDEEVPALLTIFPLRGEKDELVGYGVVSRDLSQQKEEEQRQSQIMSEATHRIKNTLAVVHAIVAQTLKSASNLDEGRETISKRVAALAKAQDILTSAEGALADIADVVDSALAPHDAGHGRISFAGPARLLPSKQALGLSLALHELATNAAKYGALSGEEGTVRIDWGISGDEKFVFEWIESGGPNVSPPLSLGFGSKLIQRMVAPYFGGKAKLDYLSEGVRFRLEGTLHAAE